MLSRLLRILVVAALSTLIVGCTTLTDGENIQDRATDAVGPIGNGRIVGQTFVSNKAGLNGIQILPVVYEGPLPAPDATLTLRLRSTVESDADIATSTVKISELKHNAPYRFTFSPVAESKDKPFYFFLQTSEADSRISVWSSKLDTYPWGSRQVDGREVGGDITFRTFYEYDAFAIGSDLAEVSRGYTDILLPLLVVFVIPGYTLLWLHPRRSELDLAEVVGLSVGLSIAVAGVGILYTKLLGIRIDSSLVHSWGILLAVVAAVQLLGTLRRRREWRLPKKETLLFAGSLVFVLLVATAIRFLHIKDLVVPMWVDSPQHAEIIQLIIDNGGLPDSYRPFADIEPFTYHYGFHALVALFHWQTGVDIPKSMLVIGQVLNAAMPLIAYVLANRMLRSKIAGLVCALVVGLISIMPAYYVSWGRYTQLTGMVLLAIVVVLTVESVVPSKTFARLRILPLAAIAAGGLIIAHPRVTVFYLCFLLAFLALEILSARARLRTFSIYLTWLVLVGFLGVVIILPWMVNNLNPLVARIWEGASQASPSDNPFPFQYITALNDKFLIATAAGGLAIGVVKRHKGALLVAVWIGLTLLSANLHLIGLPGSMMISNGAAAIALFLPISLLAGYVVSSIAGSIKFETWPFSMKGIAAIGMVLIGLYSAQGLLGIVNPATAIFTKEDSQAMEWIRQNTPKDAKFLINSYNWQFGVYAGTDGGYWIPALTGRKASTPSLVYALGGTTSRVAVSSVAQRVGATSTEDEMRDLLRANGITHIYIGYRGGTLHPGMFIDKPGYRAVYAGGGVWVFEVAAD